MQLSFSVNNFGVRPSASNPGDGASDVVLVEEAAFSPSYIFSAFVKDKLVIAVWLHICSCLIKVET
jgi:hypothetical protein